MIRYVFLLIVASLLAALLPRHAQAQDTGSNWGANITVVSDYRYHGTTLSDEEPVLQADLTYEADSGFFAEAFVSQVADNGGDDLEVDLGAGYTSQVAGFDVTVGAVAYLYPGAEDDNLTEAYVSVERPISETVTVGAEFRYAPEQNDFGTDNSYAAAFAEVSVSDTWTVNASVGLENGFYDNKFDWSVGAEYDFGPAAVGVAWVGFEEADVRDDAVVVSLSVRF